MKIRQSALLAFFLILFTNGLCNGQCRYLIDDYPPPPSNSFLLRGVSADLAICGSVTPGVFRTPWWHDGTSSHLLQTPTGFQDAVAMCINSSHVVAGDARILGVSQAVRWIDEEYELLPLPPEATASFACDINESGAIVGFSADFNFVSIWEAYIFTSEDGLVGLNSEFGVPYSAALAINNSGTIVGYFFTDPFLGDRRPYIYASDGFTAVPLPPYASQAELTCISSNNIAAGVYEFVDPPPNLGLAPFAWIDGEWVDLELPPHPELWRCVPTSISDAGHIVGWWDTAPAGGDEGQVIWIDGKIFDLAELTGEPQSFVFTKMPYISEGSVVVTGINYESEKHLMITKVIPVADVVGDVSRDCIVDHIDLFILFEHWGTNLDQYDIDGSGLVDVRDLLLLLENWTA